MDARSNKEYLAIINGVEEAKSEKKLRQESVNQLQGQIDELSAKATAAGEARDTLKAEVETMEKALAELGEQANSANELQRLYDDQKAKVEPKFLQHYERLVASNHRMPLMKVDAVSRATPYGNMVSTNQLEHIRLGELVIDQGSNAILYVADT